MAKEKKTVPLLTTKKDLVSVEQKFESVGDTPFNILYGGTPGPGELVQEIMQGPKKETRLNRYIYKHNEGMEVCIPLTMPPHEIDPDMYYPMRKIRMTQTRFNEMDFVPAGGWVKENLKDQSGAIVRNANGVPVMTYFWCMLSIESLREEDECIYTEMEFAKGSDIIDYNKAKNLVGFMGGLSRQRVEDDADTVTV